MLLYDQVREHAERVLRRVGPETFGKRNLQELASLRACVVFEVSDVVPLIKDYARDKDKALPWRPTHDPVWAEWRCRDASEDGRFYDAWTLGVSIRCLGEEMRKLLAQEPPRWDGAAAFVAALAAGREHYIVQMFKRLDAFCHDPNNHQAQTALEPLSFEESERANRESLNTPACDLGFFVWSHNPDGSGVYQHKFYPGIPEGAGKLEAARSMSLFFLRLGGCVNHLEHWGVINPWPAFMSFALLHCRNILAEDVVPGERIQRECKKHGRPPRITFKVLKLEVPQTAHVRRSYEGGEDDSGPKVRLHLCRGHFKHLQAERYTNKRGQLIWCPMHLKGSKELGEVHKRYQLTPGQQGGPPATSE
jgi:hypothetical protein